MPALPLDSLVAEFLTSLAHERRLAAHTITNYQRDLRQLIDAFAARPIQDVRATDVRQQVGQCRPGVFRDGYRHGARFLIG